MKALDFAVLFIVILVISSCVKGDMKGSKSSTAFFDLSSFADQIRQDSPLYTVVKTIEVDGQSETQTIEGYTYWKDVEFFANYDINRPALLDKYKVDTLQIRDTARITYQALEDDLKVLSLEVHLVDENVITVLIESLAKSFLEEVDLEINWNLTSGYSMTRNEKRLLGSTSIQKIRVEIQDQ